MKARTTSPYRSLPFMMLALSKPFVGPLALESSPFGTSLHVFDDVDRGT